MTFYDAALLTEREILVMATSSNVSAREISLVASEASKALGYELRDNLKHFKRTKHCSRSQMARTKMLELECLNSMGAAAALASPISSADDFLLQRPDSSHTRSHIPLAAWHSLP